MHAPKKPNENRWQRVLRSALYGLDVDRNVKAKARLGLAILAFAGIFSVIALRLVMFATTGEGHGGRRSVTQDAVATARPDILDRNGEILATDIKTPSLFAEPRKIIDVDEAVELLTAVLPDLDATEVRDRLSSKRGFVWLKREITPSQQQEIHRLGIPGVGFLTENKRVYPNGAVVSHEIGHVNIDNQGIAGIEKWLDGQGLAALHMAGLATDQLQRPVRLAVDLRVQYALRDELIAAREKFKAKASAGIVADVNTGEIIAMVSEPDFDPNNPSEANDPNRLNRLTTGVYEMGSTFKALTLAMALDSGRVSLSSSFDARAVGAGNLHLLIQYRYGAHGAFAWRRIPQGVPEKARPARPLAHRVAGKRRAAGAQTLGRAQYGHDRLRPRPVGGAAAGGDGHFRAGERRQADPADLPQARPGRGRAPGHARDQA